MKKKISIALVTILSFACLLLNMSANAVEITTQWHTRCQLHQVEANAVVVGIDRSYPEDLGYYVDTTSDHLAIVYASELESFLDNYNNLVIGDLLYIDLVGVLEMYPGILVVEDESVIEYAGNGMELFGDAFKKDLHEVYVEGGFAQWYQESNLGTSITFEIMKGDATEDETVDILDVITVNKTVLGKETMQGYAKYVSDVNENGEVDANDSLEIMKYVVGLTDTLDAE